MNDHEALRCVSIESPFDGPTPQDVENHIQYAWAAMRHSITLGESPFASHLLYTQILKDKDLDQRIVGLALGHAWRLRADALAVYIDLGLSPGMQDAIALAEENDVPVSYRRIYSKDKSDAPSKD